MRNSIFLKMLIRFDYFINKKQIKKKQIFLLELWFPHYFRYVTYTFFNHFFKDWPSIFLKNRQHIRSCKYRRPWCVVFLVHGMTLQQWIPLLKNCASAEKNIMLTVKQLCQWLLKNCARDSWRILWMNLETRNGRVL